MADLNIVEKANKIITFRKYIRDICRKKGLEYPSDAKIAEYIADCGGDECVYDLNDFMCDYENKIGVFRDPFGDFKAEIDKFDWADKPTDEEMREYIVKNGYDVEGFLRQHTINGYSPLEKKVLLNVLEKCSIPQLVGLWNTFIEEAAVYGEDSYIYDLAIHKDVEFLNVHMEPNELSKVKALARNGVRYVQWFSCNDKSINGRDDESIKGTIVAYWSDIFPRLLTWTCECYDNIGIGKTTQHFPYFYDSVVRPVLLEALGYNYDPSKGTIEEIKKS